MGTPAADTAAAGWNGCPEGQQEGKTKGVPSSPKVIVVGAGIAGIAAADVLCREGFGDVVVLEATDRVGGRIWSIDIGKRLGLDFPSEFVILTRTNLVM